MSEKTFTERVVEVIKSIPHGNVATYGQLAAMAGNPRGARQVVRVLHTLWEKEKLPWHRVINAKGTISLTGAGFDEQKVLLEAEGVAVDGRGAVDLKKYQWRPAENVSA
ncbi:MAG: methylated-DNA--[protein]-cysteine S-methyltransferase [candidate division Zixibacteria bacterium]|nr:methylated-DNA--[protein]-cysteine S-methyltransferase [candidate division Zixibacteria bacterium]